MQLNPLPLSPYNLPPALKIHNLGQLLSLVDVPQQLGQFLQDSNLGDS